MLHGIDISNWQKGLSIPESLDFAIMKATGGTGYVDPCCDDWVSECKRKGILWGYYHFAGDGYAPNPEAEAVFFWQHTKCYNKQGIPILDIEDERISNWGDYAQRFVDKYHACSGIYPLIYASASTLSRFAGYPVVDDCDLWIAGYPDDMVREIGDVPRFPYKVSPWTYAAIWQYSSNGKIRGYDELVDLDIAYMDERAWHLYSDPDYIENPTQVLPNVGLSPDEDNPTWSFENSHVKVDVTLK